MYTFVFHAAWLIYHLKDLHFHYFRFQLCYIKILLFNRQVEIESENQQKSTYRVCIL